MLDLTNGWVILLLIALVGAGLFAGRMASERWPSWDKWTGLGQKKLLDYLQLILIPVILWYGATWFNGQQTQTSREISLAQQQEAALESYLDRMSDLLLNHALSTSKSGDEVRLVAQQRTLLVLHQLDPDRRALVVEYLYRSGLIFNPQTLDDGNPIISLVTADLQDAQLGYAHLSRADLQQVILTGASLHDTILTQVNLLGACLNGANLKNAQLDGALIEGADTTGAFSADLSKAAGKTYKESYCEQQQ